MKRLNFLWNACEGWIKAFIGAFIFWLIVRSFFFEIYYVPSASMRQTLAEGDYIVVNKLAFGARLPITPIASPFAHQAQYVEWLQLPYWRFPGLTTIKHNDVIVFNYPAEGKYPVDQRTHLVKRCVALPGDTFSIINRMVTINHKLLPIPQKVQFSYTVATKNGKVDSLTISKLGLEHVGIFPGKGKYSFFMSSAGADSLKQATNVVAVEANTEDQDTFDEYIFPHNKNYKWNLDNFGPLVIPRKGDSITLNKTTIYLYKRIIVQFEKNTLEQKGDSILINDQLVRSYTFKMNYYFTMGDNRHFSHDSRVWGFLPENHIIGKASYILLSKNKEPFYNQEKRRFKSID